MGAGSGKEAEAVEAAGARVAKETEQVEAAGPVAAATARAGGGIEGRGGEGDDDEVTTRVAARAAAWAAATGEEARCKRPAGHESMKKSGFRPRAPPYGYSERPYG